MCGYGIELDGFGMDPNEYAGVTDIAKMIAVGAGQELRRLGTLDAAHV
jgi:hypothetical protein